MVKSWPFKHLFLAFRSGRQAGVRVCDARRAGESGIVKIVAFKRFVFARLSGLLVKALPWGRTDGLGPSWAVVKGAAWALTP